ncbi:MAG: AIR synthase [Firmicutes bacterium]|nr:AIR synthase [Bacillota bacterium]
MKVGKLSGELLQQMVLSTIRFQREDVLVHAGLGEDCAAIDFGDEVCLVSSDPITGAVEGIGELAVHVACNDIAANGGTPVGVQIVLLLPEHIEQEQIHTTMEDIHRTAAELGVEVIGGHTEITSRVKDCVISVTAIGRAPKSRYVTSGGAQIGDDLVISKGVAIEATAILARDFHHKLPFAIMEEEIRGFTKQLSVVPEGLIAAEFSVNAMHDITEGGLLGAVREVCQASKVGAEVWEEQVPVLPLTKKIAEYLELDPLALLSSGSMLMVTSDGEGLVARLAKEKIPAYIVGKMTEGNIPVLVRETGEREAISTHVEDELWKFWARKES